MSVPAVLLAFGISLRGSAVLSREHERLPVVLAVVCKSVGQPLVAWALGAGVFGLPPAALFAAGLGVAVLSAVLPYALEPAALRLVPPRTVAVLQSLEPAAGGAAGLLVLGERLHPAQWLALGCVGVACAGAVAGVRRGGGLREDVDGPSVPPR